MGSLLWMLLPAAFTLASACAPRVAVPVAARPAVELARGNEAPVEGPLEVAVVAHERRCQPMADALAEELWSMSTLRVDPTAPTRLEVALCGDDLQAGIAEQGSAGEVERRTEVYARSHALLVVRDDRSVRAHLIGTGRSQTSGERGLAGLGRSARRLARQDVAHDLAMQLSPGPTTKVRRVYPRAASTSARGLTTLAVRAEQAGDLTEALAWAVAAHEEKPTARSAEYLADLRRRTALPEASER